MITSPRCLLAALASCFGAAQAVPFFASALAGPGPPLALVPSALLVLDFSSPWTSLPGSPATAVGSWAADTHVGYGRRVLLGAAADARLSSCARAAASDSTACACGAPRLSHTPHR